ncbi:nuclear transport factor 2 family protein [Hymenobacter elongatus]|uniref:Nuclear transport factor 2 family protein n=1 Tax=Hymenobacter elongatus TaxID=877208 RepID=A0A4Z0PEM3_9BACT|nr:nuclear transport factor 2 family protein [Hymenobacter elongatus]TGE12616.1 nuclear transport factor 2 family protein [Hymenobacter elongatus]
MHEHLAVIHTYIQLSEALATDPAAYAAVLHPEVIQTEYPNILYKTLQQRTFSDIIDNLRIGRELLHDPQFAVHSTRVCADGSILIEGRWEATITSEIGPLVRGQRLAAQLCLIFELKDGKIFRQRRYPCFDAF